MTPKEKAKELYDKYELIVHNVYDYAEDTIRHAKECALIAVDEIIDTLTDVMWINNEHTDFARKTKYWQEVKQEIEKL